MNARAVNRLSQMNALVRAREEEDKDWIPCNSFSAFLSSSSLTIAPVQLLHWKRQAHAGQSLPLMHGSSQTSRKLPIYELCSPND